MATSKVLGNKNTLLKVVILGDGGVGKSCLMNRFVNNQFDDHSFHTIGVEFLNKEMKIKNESFTLQIWDTAGQERFKSLRTPFYRGSDICMLTFSLDDKASFRNIAMWRNEFLYYADIKDGKKFPFIVVANKQKNVLKTVLFATLFNDGISQVDIEDKREVSEAEAKSWCIENGNLPYVETSAKVAINVDYAFNLAVDIWTKFEDALDNQGLYQEDTIKLQNQVPDNKTPCCNIK